MHIIVPLAETIARKEDYVMKFLITGVAGFIGSSLASRLSEDGHTVIGIDNLYSGNLKNLRNITNLQFHQCDIRDKNARKFYSDVDVVFHFAGISSLAECQSDPVEAYSVNSAGTAEVLEAARLAGVLRVLFASTSAVYENCTAEIFTESLQTAPDLTYGLSKKFSEDICLSYSQNYSLPISVVRFFNVYGPHQNYLRKSPPLVGYIAKTVLQNQVPNFYSDGTQRRDYIYIEDLLELVKLVAFKSKKSFEIINACTGNLASVAEIYEIVKNIEPNAKEPIYRDSTNFWTNYEVLSSGKYPLSTNRISKEVNKTSKGSYKLAFENYGWSPNTDLMSGISKVFLYMRQHARELLDANE